MNTNNIQIEKAWFEILKEDFKSSSFKELQRNLDLYRQSGLSILPPCPLIFNAFNLTPWHSVKVVVIGQDPYHKKGQAMGLSFSVPKGIKVPPSLRNIYKELTTTTDFVKPGHGDLSTWSKQGVLMLNAMLTVEESKAGSHKNLGWESFTDQVIKKLSNQKENLVFMLWGNFAKSKENLIDSQKHLILKAAHPSPLARGAFFGSRHFSLCNQYLKEKNRTIINWQLPIEKDLFS